MRCVGLSAYAGLFLLVTLVFVVWYEEPALASQFGADYDAYRARVGRFCAGPKGPRRVPPNQSAYP